MIPLVVFTYPENGSNDVVLDNPIIIRFASSINFATVTTQNVVLHNTNDGREITCTYAYDAVTYELTITPQDNAYGNMLLGLTRYRLVAANLTGTTDGEVMVGTYSLDFTTVSDSIVDVVIPPVVDTVQFEATNFFPKKNAYDVSPSEIKIKFNKDVSETSVNENTFIVTPDPIEDLQDIGFISISTVTGDYTVTGPIVTFAPYSKTDGSIGVGSVSGTTPRSIFTLPQNPIYRVVVKVDGVTKTVDIDYTVNMTKGQIIFLSGYEPAVGLDVWATSFKSIPLSDNQQYTIVLNGIESADYLKTINGVETTVHDDLPATMYSFYSKFSPAYATISEVSREYSVIANLVKTMSPTDVLELIKSNSDMAEFIAEQAGNTSIDWTNPPKYVIEYVKTKTRYDILFDKYLQISSDSSRKMLGDLEIEYANNLSQMLALADRLREMYLYWENMLKGSTTGKVTPKPFRKGENVDEDPEYMNRQFKDWAGTKSWTST